MEAMDRAAKMLRMSAPQLALQFRIFRVDDAVLLHSWLRASGLGLPQQVAGQRWAQRVLEDPNICCWAAVQQGRSVGFFRLDLSPDRSAEITLIVHPERRRLGLGRSLLGQALIEARRQGLRRLLAVVEESNQVALDFFQVEGFTADEVQLLGYAHLYRRLHSAAQQPPLEIQP